MCTGQMYRIAPLFSKGGTYLNKEDRKYTIQHGARLENLNVTGKYDIQPIKCGYCMECRLEKAKEWAFRCMKEAEEHGENNYMITITYDDKHVPKVRKTDEETGEVLEEKLTLVKKDAEKFRKAIQNYFRYQYKHSGIKYRYCGEYGGSQEYFDWKGEKRKATKRPHYHMLFFNLPIPKEELRFHKYSKCEWSKEKNILWKWPPLEKLWKKGWVDINEVNYETCCYVSRYIMKKQYGEKGKDEYEEKGIIPPFTTQSNRPGIGHAYYVRHKEKFENEDTFWQRTKNGLQEIKPGRYFDKQIEKENPDLLEAMKERRKQKSKAHWKEILEKTGLTKEEYIANRVSKVDNRIRFLKRSLI